MSRAAPSRIVLHAVPPTSYLQVYYNNLLSMPPILVLMWVFNEFPGLLDQPALKNPHFQAVALLGGFVGFAISFSSLWFLSQTTATIYSITGALNKIPVAVVGLVAFHEPTNSKNLASIIIGLTAGVIFVQAKSRGSK
jgi:GDP-mannose transporter